MSDKRWAILLPARWDYDMTVRGFEVKKIRPKTIWSKPSREYNRYGETRYLLKDHVVMLFKDEAKFRSKLNNLRERLGVNDFERASNEYRRTSDVMREAVRDYSKDAAGDNLPNNWG